MRFVFFFSLLCSTLAYLPLMADQRPNVLWLCIEDIGPFLGCYGWEAVKTPELDRLSRDAVLFEDVHCNVALCTPSRTSVLTGIRPSTSGIVKIDDDWQTMLPKAVSLPRHFKDNGYYVHGVGKIYDGRCGGMDNAFHVDDNARLETNERPLAALDLVAGKTDPWLLMIGWKQVHTEWTPQPWAYAEYEGVEFDPDAMSRNYRGKELDAAGLQDLLRNFFAYITEVDRFVGEIVREAESRGLLENTILMVGSMDHGFSLGWRGKWGKGNNYDMETMVPLMVRLPENPNNGRRAPGIVELVDLYPTLLELCELPDPPQQLEGLSFVPLLDNPGKAWKQAAFTHKAYHLNDVGVKTKRWNLIADLGQPLQLYDRQADPINLVDVATEYPEVVKELREFINLGWRHGGPLE